MTDIAISCENLGKRYRIGQRESYRALRDVLTDSIAAPSAVYVNLAIRNLNFEIRISHFEIQTSSSRYRGRPIL